MQHCLFTIFLKPLHSLELFGKGLLIEKTAKRYCVKPNGADCSDIHHDDGDIDDAHQDPYHDIHHDARHEYDAMT